MSYNRIRLEWIPSAYREEGKTAKKDDVKAGGGKPALYGHKGSVIQHSLKRNK